MKATYYVFYNGRISFEDYNAALDYYNRIIGKNKALYRGNVRLHQLKVFSDSTIVLDRTY